jgi:hypothetical protein
MIEKGTVEIEEDGIALRQSGTVGSLNECEVTPSPGNL